MLSLVEAFLGFFSRIKKKDLTPPRLSLTCHESSFAALGDEFQRDAIVAPAFACRRRAVVEDMAVVAAAANAMILCARQDQLKIRAGAEDSWNDREKARPPGAALVFHLRRKQGQIAAGAGEDSRPFLIVQRA